MDAGLLPDVLAIAALNAAALVWLVIAARRERRRPRRH
jgi:hypothetical protein